MSYVIIGVTYKVGVYIISLNEVCISMDIKRRTLKCLAACLLLSGVFSAGEAAVRLSLAESVERALALDPTIAAAEASAEAAAWQLSSARRSAGPKITWSSQALRLGGEDYASTDRRFSNRLNLEIPLYTGGQIEGSVQQYRSQADAAALGVEGERQAVRFRAIEAYYDVLQRKNLLQVAESAVRMASEQLHLLNIQFNEGTVARSDVLEMQVQMADYEQNLLSAQGALAVAETTLRSVLGLAEDAEIELIDAFTYEPYAWTLSDCIDYGLQNRPDRTAADCRIKQAEAQKRVAESAARPRVAGVLSRTIAGDAPFGDDRSENWQVGAELSWNVFDNQVTAANVKAAEKATAKFVADKKETERTIRLDIQKAYRGMKTAEEKIHTTEKAVEQAKRNNVLAEVRYKEGVDIMLKVTDAQEKLVRARTNYYTALYEYNLNKAALERAMGVAAAPVPAVHAQ